MSVVTTRKDGEVLIIALDNPPVNALGADVRKALAAAAEEAASDDGVKAVVVTGTGKMFSAGADITEFGKEMPEPHLPAVIKMFEDLPKPVVAAINGTALGGGLELALGCNYRLAAETAKVGLPEVNLGILPGAGGTQRLPRIAGVETALEMIVWGKPVSAGKALAMGVVQSVHASAELLDAAVDFARSVIGRDEHPVSSERRDKITDVDPAVFDEFRARNARKLKGLDAPETCIQTIKLATEVPYPEGAEFERAGFRRLVQGDQSKSLRHSFFAERKAAKIEGLPADTQILPIRKVGIIGAGTMGGGIAMNFLSAGYEVTLVEREQAALDRGVGVIRKNYEATAAKGRMKPEAVEAAMGLLTGSLDFADFADCDLVIEAVFEDMEIKKSVFGLLDAICKPDAILASNTSFLDVDEIAAATSRPEWVLGMHFFSPANVMRLLEIVRGAKTSPQVLATAMDVGRKIGKVAVVAGVCHGFIGNRMIEVRQNQADQLLLEGATPAQIDKVLTDYGMPMGPCQMMDLAGLDIGWSAETTSSSTVEEVLCEMGRRGQKTGAGYYDYDDKRQRSSSPEVEAMIRDFAAKKGYDARDISDEEILVRLLYPMVNEGAKIVDEGIAQRASDVDVVYVNGYGWPAWRGGPMFWAETIGLDTVVTGLEKYAQRLPDLTIADSLRAKAAAGETFNG